MTNENLLYSTVMYILEKERATHSSILAWRIPWAEESGGIQSMGSQRAGRERRRLRRRTGAGERSYPTSEVRGGGQEELPNVQGAVAARAQEGLEELFHIQVQEGEREGQW